MERSEIPTIRDGLLRIEELTPREAVERLAWCFSMELRQSADMLVAAEGKSTGLEAQLDAAHAGTTCSVAQLAPTRSIEYLNDYSPSRLPSSGPRNLRRPENPFWPLDGNSPQAS